MAKVKMLLDDISMLERWKAGEIGVVLSNDFEKYDYFIGLPYRRGDIFIRRYHFYKEEVEVIDG